MTSLPFCRKVLLVLLCFGFAFGVLTTEVRADDIRCDSSFIMAPNGDCNVSIKVVPSMALYQKLRESVSNLYLVMRTFASSRADTETVDKKADWDDSNHTLNFSMKMLGVGRNMGNHWEVDVPKEMEFSNLDDSKRTLFLTQAVSGDDWTMRGLSQLVLPPGARDMKYDAGRRVASYVLPKPAKPMGSGLLWIAAAVLVGLGAVATTLSFVGPLAGARSRKR